MRKRSPFTGSPVQPGADLAPVPLFWERFQAQTNIPNSAINPAFSHQEHPSVLLLVVRTTSAKLPGKRKQLREVPTFRPGRSVPHPGSALTTPHEIFMPHNYLKPAL